MIIGINAFDHDLLTFNFLYEMEYKVVIEKTEHGYSAYVPALPGVLTTGETLEEVKSQIEEAVMFHLDGANKEGVDIPKPMGLSFDIIH